MATETITQAIQCPWVSFIAPKSLATLPTSLKPVNTASSPARECTILVQDAHGYDYLATCSWQASYDHSRATKEWFHVDLALSDLEQHMPGSLPQSVEEQAVVVPKTWSPVINPLLRLASEQPYTSTRTLRLLIPATSGYVARSDWIERRLLDSAVFESVVAFASPREYFKASVDFLRADLHQVMNSVCAAMLLQESASLQDADLEISKRLTWAWISPSPVSRFRLAVVDGRRNPKESSASEGIFRAAKALDIGLVMIDRPGHWLECDPQGHIIDEFIPTDISLDDNLVSRIVNSVKSCAEPIDGIITWTDQYLLPVAKAAAILGLSGNDIEAVAACVDKSLTRSIPGSAPIQCYNFNSLSELDDIIHNHGHEMIFPMVLKPCSGTSSEGVFKVCNPEELRTMAARNAGSKSVGVKYGNRMLVETYISGPEVDVNLVVIDGELLFSDISDDFPSPADTRSQLTDSFTDTGNAMPSRLPTSEKDMLLQSFKDVLSRMGLHTGIFHFEGRVRDSSMEYSSTGGVVDLHTKTVSNAEPSPFIIEINARMPGNMGTGLIERLYGVDYYALYMLLAVRDLDRARRFAAPYACGFQYHGQVLRLPAHKGGVWTSGDTCQRLLETHEDLRPFVSHFRCLYRDGLRVPDPKTDVVVCVGFFYVYSRKSREEMLRISQRILEVWNYDVVEEPDRVECEIKSVL